MDKKIARTIKYIEMLALKLKKTCVRVASPEYVSILVKKKICHFGWAVPIIQNRHWFPGFIYLFIKQSNFFMEKYL